MRHEHKSVLPDTIDSIIEKGIPTVFDIMGGGSGAIYELMKYGGGEVFLLEAHFSFAFIGKNFCKYQDMQKTTSLACQQIGYQYSEDVIRLATIARLDTGDNNREICICIRDKNKERLSTLKLAGNNMRTRVQEEQVVSDLIIKEYCTFLGVPCFPPSLYKNEKVVTEEIDL